MEVKQVENESNLRTPDCDMWWELFMDTLIRLGLAESGDIWSVHMWLTGYE